MNRAIKCKNCLEMIPAGVKECPSCHADRIDSLVEPKRDNFYGPCEVCGKEGRKIERGLEYGKVTYYRCFDCYDKEKLREAYPVTKKGTANWPPAYKAYIKGLTEYRLKPLFYRRQPNEVMLNKLWLEVMIEKSTGTNKSVLISSQEPFDIGKF